MQQIIQLQPEDDIASIRARLEAVDLSYVVLVVPRDCPALETGRGLQLLRRAAEDTGVEVGLVVQEGKIRERAVEFGFPVFTSIDAARHGGWRMQPLAKSQTLAPEQLTRGSGAWLPFFFSRDGNAAALSLDRIREWRLAIAVIIAVAFLLFGAAILLVPVANVRIVPASIALTLSTDAIIDPTITQVNAETRSVPARRITREISGTAQLKTVTTKGVPDARSTGTVIFTNLRTEETTIPPGTVVKTSAGVPIRFTTTTTATLPAGINSRVEVPVQALDPGPSGNVRELAINRIEGSLNLEANVINLRPTVSGNVKPVRVVTEEDKRKLEAQLLRQLQQQSASILQQAIKPQEFIPPDSVVLDVNDKTFDHSVDDPADVLNLRMTADAYGLAVDPDDLDSLVGALLQKQMQPGYQLLPNGVQSDVLLGGKYQGVALRVPIRGIGNATPRIDVNKVSSVLQGKTADEAAALLSNAVKLAQPPEINISPMGWNRMPWFGFRIAVFVEPPPVTRK